MYRIEEGTKPILSNFVCKTYDQKKAVNTILFHKNELMEEGKGFATSMNSYELQISDEVMEDLFLTYCPDKKSVELKGHKTRISQLEKELSIN